MRNNAARAPASRDGAPDVSLFLVPLPQLLPLPLVRPLTLLLRLAVSLCLASGFTPTARAAGTAAPEAA